MGGGARGRQPLRHLVPPNRSAVEYLAAAEQQPPGQLQTVLLARACCSAIAVTDSTSLEDVAEWLGGNGRIPARAPSPLPGRHEKHTQTKRQAREAARQAALEEEAERQQERQKWEEPLRTAKERWQQQRQEREELLRAAEERRQQQRQKWEEWQRADKARRQQQVLPLARPLAAAASGTAALQPPSTRPLPSLRAPGLGPAGAPAPPGPTTPAAPELLAGEGSACTAGPFSLSRQTRDLLGFGPIAEEAGASVQQPKPRADLSALAAAVPPALLPAEAPHAHEEPERRQLIVQPSQGKPIIVHVHPKDTFKAVKAAIQEATGIPSSQQWLKHGSKALEDGRTLADTSIESDSVVYQLLRLKGGAGGGTDASTPTSKATPGVAAQPPQLKGFKRLKKATPSAGSEARNGAAVAKGGVYQDDGSIEDEWEEDAPPAQKRNMVGGRKLYMFVPPSDEEEEEAPPLPARQATAAALQVPAALGAGLPPTAPLKSRPAKRPATVPGEDEEGAATQPSSKAPPRKYRKSVAPSDEEEEGMAQPPTHQPATAPKAPAGLGSGLSHAVPPKPRPVTARRRASAEDQDEDEEPVRPGSKARSGAAAAAKTSPARKHARGTAGRRSSKAQAPRQTLAESVAAASEDERQLHNHQAGGADSGADSGEDDAYAAAMLVVEPDSDSEADGEDDSGAGSTSRPLPDGATAEPAGLRSSAADPRIFGVFSGMLGRCNGRVALLLWGYLCDPNRKQLTQQEGEAAIEGLQQDLRQFEPFGELPVAASERGNYMQASAEACAELAKSGRNSLMNWLSAVFDRVLATDGISLPPPGAKGATGMYVQFARRLLLHSHGRGGTLEHITTAQMRWQALGLVPLTIVVFASASPDSRGLVLADTAVPGSATKFQPTVQVCAHVMGPTGDGQLLMPQCGRLRHGVTLPGEVLADSQTVSAIVHVLVRAPQQGDDPSEPVAVALAASAVLKALDEAGQDGCGVAAAVDSLPQQVAVAAQPAQRAVLEVPQLADWQRSPLGFVHAFGKTAIRQLAAASGARALELTHPTITLCLQAQLLLKDLRQGEAVATARWQQLSKPQAAAVHRLATAEAVCTAVKAHDTNLRHMEQPARSATEEWCLRHPDLADVLRKGFNGSTFMGTLVAVAALTEAQALPPGQRGAALEVCQRLAGEVQRGAERLQRDLEAAGDAAGLDTLAEIRQAAYGPDWAESRAQLIGLLAAAPAGQLGDTEQRLAVRRVGANAIAAGLMPAEWRSVRRRLWQRMSSERGGNAPRTAEAAAAGITSELRSDAAKQAAAALQAANPERYGAGGFNLNAAARGALKADDCTDLTAHRVRCTSRRRAGASRVLRLLANTGAATMRVKLAPVAQQLLLGRPVKPAEIRVSVAPNVPKVRGQTPFANLAAGAPLLVKTAQYVWFNKELTFEYIPPGQAA